MDSHLTQQLVDSLCEQQIEDKCTLFLLIKNVDEVQLNGIL